MCAVCCCWIEFFRVSSFFLLYIYTSEKREETHRAVSRSSQIWQNAHQSLDAPITADFTRNHKQIVYLVFIVRYNFSFRARPRLTPSRIIRRTSKKKHRAVVNLCYRDQNKTTEKEEKTIPCAALARKVEEANFCLRTVPTWQRTTKSNLIR